MTIKNSALVLFSGGQDSTVCLAWALKTYDHVETIGFDYGQVHAIEMDCRSSLLEKLHPQGEDHVLDLPVLSEISHSSLTQDMEIEMQKNGLPNSFVPGRNILFLTTAAMLAYRKGISNLVTGVCETDYSGYPDCRSGFITSMADSLRQGMETELQIQTPLMNIDKAQTWEMAYDLGGQQLVDLIISDSHTCYRGDRSHLHAWGYGCATCPACELRQKGYESWLETRT